MNKKDLIDLGIAEDVADKIIVMHGKSIEGQKAAAAKLQTDFDALKAQSESQAAQLTEAGKQIEAFKGMDIEGVKKAAEEYKLAAEKAKTDAAAQVAALKFDHALESALTGAKAKNAKAVKALLDSGALKLNETDGSIIGLKEQLEKVKTENAYLFDGEVTDPQIVTGANPNKPTTPADAFLAAVYRGAGIEKK